jgi:apolipoprotein D and lipocalin family protein
MAHAEDMKLIFGLLAALATGPTLAAQTSPAPLRVVESVDLARYAGRWYEAARIPNRFQDQCVADVVAHYTLRTDGRIDVVNRCRTSSGKVDEARGIGRKAGDRQSSARLEVRFAPAILSFLSAVWGDYWIIGLGPEYTWAVVGAPNREYLWILSRTPEMSATSFERALEIARGNGFDVTRVVKTTNSGKAQ